MFKEINKINRAIKKKNEPKELLDKREELLDEIYENENKRKSLLVPLRGISDVEIKDVENLIKKINKDIEASKKSLEKAKKDVDKLNAMLSNPKTKEKDIEEINKSLKMLDEYQKLTLEGIKQKENQITIREEQLEYYKNNEDNLVKNSKHTT